MSHDPTQTNRCEWRERFDALVAERMRAPFVWGEQDCCMFAVACVEAITGEDRGADLRGTYSDARGALRTLEEQGGIEAVASRAGDPIHPLCASVGDVGLIEMDGRESLAVCVGDMWIAPAPQGLCAMPFSTASKAWRVAHA